MREMDYDYFAELCNARDKFCNFCESDDCEYCTVANLINDAYDELSDEEKRRMMNA